IDSVLAGRSFVTWVLVRLRMKGWIIFCNNSLASVLPSFSIGSEKFFRNWVLLPNRPGLTKLNWANKSMVLFSMGVPVIVILYFPLSCMIDLYLNEAEFLIAWDSSSMIY